MANTPRLGRELDRRRMVVGFAFNPTQTRVALIGKKRGPEGADMIGKLNGIGGGVLASETYAQAMRREFFQEAGAVVSNWDHFAIIEGDTWRLFVYRATLGAWEWRKIRTGEKSKTDEHVRRVHINRLPYSDADGNGGVYPDLRWLVPLALHRAPQAVTRVDYRGI